MTSRLITLTLLLFSIHLTSANAQVIFSTSPGGGIASASYGIDRGKFVPYAGVDVIWISFEMNSRETDFDMFETGGGEIRRYEYSDENSMDFSANLLIPHAGIKYILSDRNDIKTYVNCRAFLSIPFVKASGSETSTHYYWEDYSSGSNPDDSDIYVDEYDLDDKIAKEVLSFTGLNFGYGAEYKFSSAFSIGSEFGLQMLLNSIEDSDSEVDSWDDESYGEEWSAKLNGILRLTYAKLCLTYRI